MHLVVPFAAGLSEAGAQALHSLRLPHLERLLARLDPGEHTATGETSLNLPHEHVLARCRGWSGADGCLPFAAVWARADGLPAGQPGQAWGLLTPSYWQVGREQIVLCDPAELGLDEAESRALLQAVRELFESLGWTLYWGAPLRWYATHESLARLPTASLERVIGRPIDAWLPDRMAGEQVRRLQSEVQMLLHSHALNDARAARGAQPVNSFWLSATGSAAPTPSDASLPRIDERLRAPWLAEDWAAWVDAWQGLDVQLLSEIDALAARGDSVSLTLCGERCARRFDSAPRRGWQRLTRRWRRVGCVPLLETL